MKRIFVVLLVLFHIAMLLGLVWWRAGRKPAGTEDKPGTTAGGAQDPAANPGTKANPDPATPPSDGARKLHGLRLLPVETARARGWTPRPLPPELSDPAMLARKRWMKTEVDISATDQPLAEFLKDIDTKYGLHTRLDPEAGAEGRTVTFRVQGLAADQALDLVIKMADLAWTIDAAGVAWVTTRERAKELAAPAVAEPDPWARTFGMIREMQGMKPQPAPAPRDMPWKGKKVTVSIVRLPVAEAWDALMKALELYDEAESTYWMDETREKAAEALPVSLVAEDMPAEQAVEELLRGAGLELEAASGNPNGVETSEQALKSREARETLRKERDEEAKDAAAFRLRRVRIKGEVLTASDVAGQVASQLGVTLRAAPEVLLCAALWESDGLEQPVGEVLDILARDGELLWRWQGQSDPVEWDRRFGPRCLWVLGVVEK